MENELKALLEELIQKAKPEPGSLLVVGCSTSEILGARIGTASAPEVAKEVVASILDVAQTHELVVAAQCCEHLNRALVVERSVAIARGYTRVNAVPVPKAGGSFATAMYAAVKEPCLVASVQADLGLDIGDTLIGMHLKPVAVPVRLVVDHLGQAHLTAARTRLPFVGGARAQYDEALL